MKKQIFQVINGKNGYNSLDLAFSSSFDHTTLEAQDFPLKKLELIRIKK